MKSWRTLLLPLLPMALALVMFAISAKSDAIDTPTDVEVVVKHDAPRHDSDTRALHAEAWYYACAVSRYSCDALPAPTVMYEEMEEGLYGRYWRGSNTVLLNETLRGNEDMELVVLVHEMTHYLQYMRGAWEAPFTKERSCKLEEEAFNVGAKVAAYVYEEFDYRRRGWDAMRALTYGCPMPE